MKKAMVVLAVLFLLLCFNPGVEAHREALRSYADENFARESAKAGPLETFFAGLFYGSARDMLVSSLSRKSYGVCSCGYFGDRLVTFGVLGYVHVIDD